MTICRDVEDIKVTHLIEIRNAPPLHVQIINRETGNGLRDPELEKLDASLHGGCRIS